MKPFFAPDRLRRFLVYLASKTPTASLQYPYPAFPVKDDQERDGNFANLDRLQSEGVVIVEKVSHINTGEQIHANVGLTDEARDHLRALSGIKESDP